MLNWKFRYLSGWGVGGGKVELKLPQLGLSLAKDNVTYYPSIAEHKQVAMCSLYLQCCSALPKAKPLTVGIFSAHIIRFTGTACCRSQL